MIDDIYKSYVDCAKGIPGFVVGRKEDVPYDITELANGYVDAEKKHDELKMSQYLSALMVRYWHMVPNLYNQSRSTRFDIEDMTSWLSESFERAFKYKAWLDPKKHVSKDPKGAEKCFNQCITSTRLRYYAYFNRYDHCANINCSYVGYSFPTQLGGGQTDTISNQGAYKGDGGVSQREVVLSSDDKFDDVRWHIGEVASKGHLLDALILDFICYRWTPGHKTKHSSIGAKIIANYLKTMDMHDMNDFSQSYSVPLVTIVKLKGELNALKLSRLYTLLNKELRKFKVDRGLKSLCS